MGNFSLLLELLLFLGCISVVIFFLCWFVINSLSYEFFLKGLISRKIKNYKLHRLNDYEATEGDMIFFLENAKQKSLEFKEDFFERLLFRILIISKKTTKNQRNEIIKSTYDKEILETIKNDLRYKDFLVLSSKTHFDLDEFSFVLSDVTTLYYAVQKGCIPKEIIEKTYKNVYESKTEYGDEEITKFLKDLRHQVLKLLEDLIKIKKEM